MMNVEMVNRETPTLAKTGETARHVEARLATVRPAGRKVALTYVGLWGCFYDRVHGLYQSGISLTSHAVARGEQMEASLNKQLRQWGRRGTRQLQLLQNRFGDDAEKVAHAASAPSTDSGAAVEGQIEAQVERVLVNLGIPTRERLERLNQEIDRLNAKLDEELARKETVLA